MPASEANSRANSIVKRHQWAKSSPAIQLEWAYVEPHRSKGEDVAYNAEYVTVLLVPGSAARTMASASVWYTRSTAASMKVVLS